MTGLRKLLAAGAAALALAGPLAAQAQAVAPIGWNPYLPNSSQITDTASGVFKLCSAACANSASLTLGSAGSVTWGGTLKATGTIGLVGGAQISQSGANGLTILTSVGGTPAGFTGSTTNDNAPAGQIGEYVCAQVTNGGTPSGCVTNTSTPTSLTSNVAANGPSLSLTAGDWEVCGAIGVFPAGTTSLSYVTAWTSTASAAAPTAPNNGAYTTQVLSFTTGQTQWLAVPCARYSLSATTTVYLSGQSGFATSTETLGGFVWARRVR